MPLSPAAPRAPIHNRTIVCQGYRREDGLWDIEGRLVDTKSYAYKNEWRGFIEPGDPVHEMLVRLTLDDKLTVVAIECATENSPFALCPDILPKYQQLVGERIGAGWTRRIRSLAGGAEGCIHQSELLSVLATVALQTIGPVLAREKNNPDGMPRFVIDSCHVWRGDGDMVRRHFPDHKPGESKQKAG